MSSELPQGWASARLGDLVEPIEVADPTRTPDAVFRYIDIGSIDNEALRIGEPKTFSGKDAPSRARRVVRDGDVLFSTVRPYLRNIALASVAHSGCLTSTGISVLRAKPSVLPGYLFRLVSSNAFVEEVGRSMDGTLYPAVRDSDVLAASIPLPPLAEQRRIVERIEALFARTRRARADLERVAPLAKLYRDHTLAYAFDADWPVASIADLAEVTFDGPFGSNLKSSDYTSTGTRVVRLENIGHLHFIGDKETFISVKKGKSLARHTLQADDVLFSSFIDKEVRVCRLPRNLTGRAINKADCFCIRVDRRQALPAFVEKRLAAPVTYNDLREAVHGATRPRIGLGDLKRYRIGLPGLEAQAAIVASLDAAHGSAKNFEHEAARALALLNHLERSILTRAFRGELVPQDPNDEPASILLERAKAGGEAEGKKPIRKLRQQPNRSKENSMKDKPVPARDQLLKDSEKWPKTGLPFEAIAKRNFMPHDTLRDALFELLSGPSPVLQQRFDSEAEIMLIQRVAA